MFLYVFFFAFLLFFSVHVSNLFLCRAMCSHLVLRCHAWPKDMVFEPALTMEDSIEYFFGNVKSCGASPGTSGSVTIANAVQNIQLLHTRLQRRGTQAG